LIKYYVQNREEIVVKYTNLFFFASLFAIVFTPATGWSRPIAPEPHPFTAPVAELDLEIDAVNFSRNRDVRAGERLRSYTLPVLMRYGVAPGLEVQLGADLFVWEGTKALDSGQRASDEGFGDVSFGFKYNFWGNDGESPSAFAVRPVVVAPTNSLSPERRLWLARLELPYAVELHPGFSLEWTPDIGIAANSTELSRTVQAGSLVSFNQEVGEITDLFVEFEHAAFRERGRGPENYLNLGLTFEPLETLIVEPAVQLGTTRAADDFRLLLTLVQRYG